MAGITVGWSVGISAGMALGAKYSGMGTCQREAGGSVIKRGIKPVGGVMAHIAIRRICLRFVILGIVVLNLVTGNTIGPGIQNGPFMAI
jgi:hypothetical protein